MRTANQQACDQVNCAVTQGGPRTESGHETDLVSTRVSLILRDTGGQGIAEYVIILAVIVVAGIVLTTAFGGQLATVWGSVTTQFATLG